MDTLAITGASGFLGSHVLSECILRGIPLRLLTRKRNAFDGLPSARATAVEGDLLEPKSLEGFLLPGCTLMHLAYLQNGRQANIDATRNLIKAIKDSDTRRVIHCSTAVVVGFSAEGVITEETPPLPRGEYQLTKYRIEEILRSELPSNVELAILRPTEIIGPGGQGLRTMIRRIREGRRYRNFVYHCILKSRLFNYVSVYNVVAALIFLATSPIRQQRDIYFLSDDDDADNNYAAVEKMIGSMFHRPTDPLIDVGIPRPLLSFLFKLLPDLAPPHRVYSHAKISSRGYRKVTTLRQTITEIVAMEAVPDISG